MEPIPRPLIAAAIFHAKSWREAPRHVRVPWSRHPPRFASSPSSAHRHHTVAGISRCSFSLRWLGFDRHNGVATTGDYFSNTSRPQVASQDRHHDGRRRHWPEVHVCHDCGGRRSFSGRHHSVYCVSLSLLCVCTFGLTVSQLNMVASEELSKASPPTLCRSHPPHGPNLLDRIMD